MKKRLLWVLGLAAVITLVLRTPSLFEPYSYADEGIYLVLGQAFKKGLVFYKDIHDNKPPLLYVTAGLAGSLQNLRVILLLWNLVNLWLVWLIAKKIFQDRFWPVLASTLLFALLSSLTLFEGNIANGEIFMIMPMTAAVLLVLKERFFLAGVLTAVGFLFKVSVGFDWLGLMLFLLWQGRDVWRRWGWMLAGFLLPNLLVGGYYWWVRAVERYITAALLQNMPYLTSWGGGGPPASGLWQSGLVQRGLVLLVLTGLVFVWRRRFDKKVALLGLWLVFGLYGALLSERPYPHYMMEVVPALSLMLGLVLEKELIKKLVAAMGVILVIVSFHFYGFWRYPVVEYYKNFYQWMGGRKDDASYQRYWGEEVLIDQQVAAYIRSVTQTQNRIYVWGTAPGIYYLSGRLPVGRYTVAYHVADFDGFAETMAALRQEKPQVIVKLRSEGIEFFELDDYVSQEYQLVEVIGNREIYFRLIE